MKTNRPFVIHPMLAAAFPVLSLAAHNISEIWSFGEPTALMAGAVAVAGCLLILLSVALHSSHRAGLIASLFVLLFFSYGHLCSLVPARFLRPGGLAFQTDLCLLPPVLVIFLIATVVIARSSSSFKRTTRFLNVATVLLVVTPIYTIGAYVSGDRTAGSDRLNPLPGSAIAVHPPDSLRDIYYIILDRYACASVLRDSFGLDNTEFLNKLRERDFYVANRSFSNYHKTFQSLASSLNMEYINYLSDKLGEECEDKVPVYEMLHDYRVWRFLKPLGYRFIHFGSWWEPTSRNPYADLNVNTRGIPEFTATLLQTTPVLPISRQLSADSSKSTRSHRQQWERVLYKFQRLAAMPRIKGPTFVFAHMLIPHDPYVFDRDGNFVPDEVAYKRSRRENYVEQLLFLNKMIIELVDKLLRESSPAPIIVIQADEGPHPPTYKKEEWRFDWLKATQSQIREKVGILNAYYLPGVDQAVLYPAISPVNTFRVIANEYFGARLELLPDRCYLSQFDNRPYRLFDVTYLATIH